MRIVNICLGGPFTDGLSYQENLITKYMVKSGHKAWVLAPRWVWTSDNKQVETDQVNYINPDGVHVIRLAMNGKEDIKNKFRTFKGVYKTLEKIKPDFIFIHNVAYRDIAVVAKYLKDHPEVKAVADNHADFSNSGTNWISKNFLQKGIWRYYAKKLISYVQKFYGVLPARVDYLVDVYGLPKEKCELLVMGADDELVEKARDPLVRKEIREKYGIQNDDFLVMTGGKIDHWKTQTLLLMEAVQKINNPKVKLIVFGSVVNELKGKVNALTDGEKVQYIGWQKSEDSYPLFAATDLVVFPGRHSVFWEQVTGQGIPMLVKDWPGTHHVDLGGNVEFLTQDNADEIQKKIEELVDNPEKYEKMKTVAEEKGMRVFSYRDIVKRAVEG